MAGGPSVAVLRDIQTLFDTGTASGLSDRQLLERFASRRDASAEAAFEALGAASWADGATSLPQRTRRCDRRPGRLSGDVPGTGPAVRLDPAAGVCRELALWRGVPGSGAGAGRGGASTSGGTARCLAGCHGRRAV